MAFVGHREQVMTISTVNKGLFRMPKAAKDDSRNQKNIG
jgi:hypothetical protein